MSDKVLLRTGIKDDNVKTNPNVKDILKKFEHLSTSENGGNGHNVQKTPIAPERKLRSSLSSSSLLKSKSPLAEVTHRSVASNPKPSAKRPISVKERTKLFEISNGPNCDLSSVRSNSSATNVVSKPSQFSEVSNNNSSKSNMFNTAPATPPVKPPRTFTSAEKLKSTNSFKAHGKNTSLKVKNDTHDLKPVTSASEAASAQESGKCFRFSAEIHARKQSQDLPAEPLSPRFDAELHARKQSQELPAEPQSASKTHALRNYFKNLSNTARDLRGKKKSTNVFVDLTPTTVSPPKHYGTLKRSHSEEHIYAEPDIHRKRSSKSPVHSPKEAEPLHYMCTPLIEPKLPQKRVEPNVSNRKVVRNLIYDSFASIRCTQKDDQSTRVPTVEASDSDVSMKAIQARIIYVKSIRQISGSNICIAPKLYDALYIINVSDGQPEISHTFPLKVPEAFKYPLLPHICFPDDQLFKATSVYQSETFNFALLDKGEKILGYCLRIMGCSETDSEHHPLFVKLPVAICILSRFNAPLFYRKLLSEIEKHLTLPREKCFKYIRSLLKLGVPNAGASVSIPDYTECSENDRVVISRPLDSHIVGFEMTRALQLLDVDILVKAVASLLLERRVLFFSSTSSNLYHCCKAIVSLLYPFEWPHMFIPVLPSCLTVHCCSELPYVLGLSSNNSNSILELLAEHELLIIDIDKGAIVKSCNDEDTILPRKIQKAVLTALNLAKNMTDPTEMLRDVMISEAFVHMFVEMIGHYENHFQDQNGELTFQKEGLLKNAFSYSIQTFLQWFSETQMFDSFVNESTWRAKYRTICQDNTRTFFEKRVDEYKWELTHNSEKISRFIEKTVRNFGEMIMHKLKK